MQKQTNKTKRYSNNAMIEPTIIVIPERICITEKPTGKSGIEQQ
jgi:hypothetical protein